MSGHRMSQDETMKRIVMIEWPNGTPSIFYSCCEYIRIYPYTPFEGVDGYKQYAVVIADDNRFEGM